MQNQQTRELTGACQDLRHTHDNKELVTYGNWSLCLLSPQSVLCWERQGLSAVLKEEAQWKSLTSSGTVFQSSWAMEERSTQFITPPAWKSPAKCNSHDILLEIRKPRPTASPRFPWQYILCKSDHLRLWQGDLSTELLHCHRLQIRAPLFRLSQSNNALKKVLYSVTNHRYLSRYAPACARSQE